MEKIQIGFIKNDEEEQKAILLTKKNHDIYQEKRAKTWFIIRGILLGAIIGTLSVIGIASGVAFCSILMATYLTLAAYAVFPKFRESKFLHKVKSIASKLSESAHTSIDHSIYKKVFKQDKSVIDTTYSEKDLNLMNNYFKLAGSVEIFMKQIEGKNEIFDGDGNKIATINNTHSLFINGTRQHPLSVDEPMEKSITKMLEDGIEQIDEIDELRSSLSDEEHDISENIVVPFERVKNLFLDINIDSKNSSIEDLRKMASILRKVNDEQLDDIDWPFDDEEEYKEALAELKAKEKAFHETYQIQSEGPVKTLTIFKNKSEEEDN